MTGPYARAARLYRGLGWEGPLPVIGKNQDLPSGYSGTHGRFPTDEIINSWVEFRGEDNIVLRLPQNVIGIDIDAYDDRNGLETIEKFESIYGVLPQTWKSSSRTDGSGILFYTISGGGPWVRNLGENSHVDIIRHGHRYAVVYPSIHPITKFQYYWLEPGSNTVSDNLPKANEFPELPESWVNALTKHRGGLARELSLFSEQIGADSSSRNPGAVEGRVNPREVLRGVAPGEQDETLYRYLASLWARNLTREEMISLGMIVIQGFENSRPEDPWTPEHVVQKVNNITRNYTKGSTAQQSAMTAWQRHWVSGELAQMKEESNHERLPEGTARTVQTHEIRNVVSTDSEDLHYSESNSSINSVSDNDNDELDPPQPPTDSSLEVSEGPPDATADTDMGNSARFTRLLGNVVRYSADNQKWYIWDGTKWDIDKKNKILNLTKEVVIDLRYQALAATGRDQEVLLAWAKQSESLVRRQAMITGASAEPGLVVLADDFDRDPLLLVVQNGTYDLENGHLRKSRPGDLCSQQCGVEYDPKAKCPKWLSHIKFITHGDEELARYMQAAAGYWLTGFGSNFERAFFFLQGDGLNGKNAFIEPILEVLGTYARTGHGTLLTGNESAHPTVLADLNGARLVFIDETRKDYKLNAERIKALVGSKKIKARFMSRDFFEFEGRFKLVIAGNGQPNMSDDSDGIWSRLHEVPMLGKVGRDVPVIKDFGSVLYREEGSGILNWLIEGYEMWRKDSLVKPGIVIDTVAEHRANEDKDWLGQFIDECIIVTNESSDRIFVSETFTAWRMWCLMSNVPSGDIGTKNLFGRNFNKRMQRDFDIPKERLSKAFKDPLYNKTVKGHIGMRLVSS